MKGEFPLPRAEARQDSVIEAPRRGHSEKPEEGFAVIEKSYPEFPRLELFARSQRPGWTAWGNEL